MKDLRLKDKESQLEKGLLPMPLVSSSFHTYQKKSIEIAHEPSSCCTE